MDYLMMFICWVSGFYKVLLNYLGLYRRKRVNFQILIYRCKIRNTDTNKLSHKFAQNGFGFHYKYECTKLHTM